MFYNLLFYYLKSSIKFTAITQKVDNAGTWVNVPTMNATNSQIAAVVIEGPTSNKAIEILSSIFSSLVLLKALEIINILSTPIAKIKNGTTSAEIKESEFPK